MFETLSKGLIATKSTEEKDCKKILKHIGESIVKQICKDVFNEDDHHKVKRILQVFVVKKKTKATSGGFRKFMKKMKEESHVSPTETQETNLPITIN